MARKTERKDTALAHKKSTSGAYSSTPFWKVREGETLRDDDAEQSILARIRAMRAEGLSLRGDSRAAEHRRRGEQAGTYLARFDCGVHPEACGVRG
mgnify:CR=1 FL=1